MKISDSAVQLYSSHASIEQHQKSESLSLSVGERGGGAVDGDEAPQRLVQYESRFFERASKVQFSAEVVGKRPIKAIAPGIEDGEKKLADLNMRILMKFFERLTGREMQVVAPEEFMDNVNNVPVEVPVEAETDGSGVAVPVEQQGEGFGLVYDYYESHYEYETTSFASEGKILTEDGREIDFSVELNMSREFYSEQSLNIRMGDVLKDPLVVNFGGTAAELTQNKFAFDIDMDGTLDQISFIKGHSGYLALDKNEDGVINDGSELFGPATGKGFDELALYDLDGNGWIDENDAIYDKLRIWMKNEDGSDRLMALGEKGIGAIYLGHVDTPFALKDSENNLLGKVASSGVFLYEDGRPGTIQQVDLAV